MRPATVRVNDPGLGQTLRGEEPLPLQTSDLPVPLQQTQMLVREHDRAGLIALPMADVDKAGAAIDVLNRERTTL